MNVSNIRVALACGAIVMGMVGITAASVPLYDLFCRVTGYGGTTQRSESASATVSDVEVTVSFNADIAPDMPWVFRPAQRSVKVRLGEETLIFYTAENRSNQPVAGTATFNVTPFASGPYFSKIQCFCFQEQVLQPGQSVEMPVSFYVDPAILDDPDAKQIRDITLSYTFFKDAEETRKLSIKAPQAGPGSDPAPAG
jgi:cytochrome c oxidase assembly protein subunit 11